MASSMPVFGICKLVQLKSLYKRKDAGFVGAYKASKERLAGMPTSDKRANPAINIQTPTAGKKERLAGIPTSDKKSFIYSFTDCLLKNLRL